MVADPDHLTVNGIFVPTKQSFEGRGIHKAILFRVQAYSCEMTAFVALTLLLTPTDLVSADKLLADVDILQRAVTQLHPGLYRYNTPAQINSAFADLREGFRLGADLRTAYLRFSEIAAKLQCGHTYANFFNQRGSIVTQVFSGQDKVPFHFRWLDDRMVITRDLTGKGLLSPGSEVISMNGVPTKHILDRLVPIARADGNNLAKRRRYLSVEGTSKYEAFDIFYPLYFPPRSSTFEVEVKQGGKVLPVKVDAESLADRLARFAASESVVKPEANPWTFRWLKPGVAYLQMGTWALFNSRWDWRAYIAEVFQQIDAARATAIIVDLRGNEGGLAVGDEILARLVAKPTRFEESQNFVRYEKAPADLVPYLDTWDRSFDDRTNTSGPAERVLLANAELRPLKAGATGLGLTIQPKAPKFNGSVLVLVDSANSSATFLFAQQIKSCKLGTLIGETTGGNLRGFNGGNFYFLRLPNSGIEIDIPLVAGFPMQPQPDGGLHPDIKVQFTAADIAAGRDPVLQRALGHLQRRRSPSIWDSIIE